MIIKDKRYPIRARCNCTPSAPGSLKAPPLRGGNAGGPPRKRGQIWNAGTHGFGWVPAFHIAPIHITAVRSVKNNEAEWDTRFHEWRTSEGQPRTLRSDKACSRTARSSIRAGMVPVRVTVRSSGGVAKTLNRRMLVSMPVVGVAVCFPAIALSDGPQSNHGRVGASTRQTLSR